MKHHKIQITRDKITIKDCREISIKDMEGLLGVFIAEHLLVVPEDNGENSTLCKVTLTIEF